MSGAFQAANSQFTITGSIDDSSAEIRCYSDADCSGEGSLIAISKNAGSDGRFSWNFEEKTGSEGKTLYEQVLKTGKSKDCVHYFEEVLDAKDFVIQLLNRPLSDKFPDGYLFVTMGAGDNWKLGKAVLNDYL